MRKSQKPNKTVLKNKMQLFFYGKTANHTSSDTEKLILISLEKWSGQSAENFKIIRNANGKPFIDGKNIYVGATHTDDLAIIAVDAENFGIDCEKSDRTIKNAEKIAKRYFSENENAYAFANSTNEEEKRRRFLEIWVKKEAYVKFLGTGISDMRKFDSSAHSENFERVTHGDYIIFIYRQQ